MSEEIGSIHYSLDLDKKDFEKGIDEAKSSIGGFDNTLEDMTNSSKKLAVGVAALGTGAAVYANQAVKAFNIQAEAEAKLIQLHKVNTGATDEQVKSLLDQASALQAVGIVGDEAIINGQAQLSTFKLSTDAIKSLTPAMTDMVAQQKGVNATGADFVNVGNLIGKVMEGQVGALGRYGVSFSEAQEEILKTGTETERAAALAEVLAQNYGGVNEALRDTFEGQMQSAKNTMGDFNELVGSMVVEYITPLIQSFNDWADSMGGPEAILQKITTFVTENEDALKALAIGITAMLVPALVAWGIAATKAAIATLIAAAPLIALGLVVAALAFLVIKNWDRIKFATEVLKGAFSSMVNFLGRAMSRVFDIITRPFRQALGAITKVASRIKEQMNKLNPFAKFSPSLVEQVKKGVGVIQSEFSTLSDISMNPVAHSFEPGQMGGTNMTTVNVGQVNEKSDIDMITRELGFRSSLAI